MQRRSIYVGIKCKSCNKIFEVIPSMKDVLKTCSRECNIINRIKNGHELTKKIGSPIRRGEALKNMIKTKKQQAKNGELKHIEKFWNKKGEWTKDKNPRWKPIGSISTDHYGYKLIKVADGKGWKNWKRQHVHVMELKIGREIDSSVECVHHINENKEDNRIENLELMSHTEHKRLHGLMRTNLFIKK